MVNVQESKLFSKLGSDKKIVDALTLGSGIYGSQEAKQVAKMRHETYGKLFSNYEGLKKEFFKTYSSYGQSDLLGNQYFNATLMGLAKSMAGYLSIERDMDQPKALLWYLDLEDVTNGYSAVLPNLGPDNLGTGSGYGTNLSVSSYFTATTGYSAKVQFAKELLPGSVKIVMVIGGITYNIGDDKTGQLTGPSGLLQAVSGLTSPIIYDPEINYATGQVQFNLASGIATSTADTYTITAAANQTDVQGQNRFTTDWKSILVDTYPELLTVETNLAAIAAQKKAIGLQAQDISVSKLIELYTKMVNKKLVNAIQAQDAGNSITINLGVSGQFFDYRSNLDKFTAQLVDVDMALALKSYKGVKATSYVVGSTVAATFRKLKQFGSFIDSPQSYINDLVGFYNGVPVLEHTDIPANTGYAIHKTTDGQLAPTIRGVFLPLTNTPAIGNYNNVSQLGTGVFYQERNTGIAPALQQSFSITNSGGIL